MANSKYPSHEALNPFFEVVMKGLSGLVDGEHYFDTFSDDSVFESRYHFPGWPLIIRGRANLVASLAGYGKTIRVHSADALVVHRSDAPVAHRSDALVVHRSDAPVGHRSQDSRVVILEYEVHGKILSTGGPYDNRLISVVTIENRKIVHWRDYMDSLAAWTALNPAK